MELCYTTTAADYRALLEYQIEKSILGRRFSRFAWIAIASLAWLSVLLPYWKMGELGWGFACRAVLAVIITLGFPVFYRRYNDGVLAGIVNDASVRGLAGATVLQIANGYVEQRTRLTTTRMEWAEVLGLESRERHEFILMTPLLAIAVPASAFSSVAQRREFQALILERISASRQVHGSPVKE